MVFRFGSDRPRLRPKSRKKRRFAEARSDIWPTAVFPFAVRYGIEWKSNERQDPLNEQVSMPAFQTSSPRASASNVARPEKQASTARFDDADQDHSSQTVRRLPWYQSTLAIGLFGSLLLWASLPPLHWWPLAWVAPLPWLLLILRPRLEGRRPKLVLYFVGFAFWMGTLNWLRLPHWATNFGWVAISGYLAVYPLLFVMLSRVAVRQFGLSIVVAAPLVWTGLEVARGYMFGGFTLSSLAHTQYLWHDWIQLADVVGGYGLGGLVMLVAACLARTIPWAGQRMSVWPIAPLVLAMVVPLGYGAWRTGGDHTRPGATVALIQGTIDTTFEDEPGKDRRVMDQYGQLTDQAVEHRRRAQLSDPDLPDIDLIVWPESMFRAPLISFSPDYEMPPEIARWAEGRSKQQIEVERSALPGQFFARWKAAALVGLGREHLTPLREQRFNSAAFISADGELLNVYDKMHLVMFGEYVPLFSLWPSLYKLTPMGEGLTPGERAVAEEIGGVWFSPSICYETVIPHLFRRQIHQLRRENREPDVLVNLTNDGWFWGSSELDLHLICGVFRAVECRKPLLIAANTGFSAWVDGDGRIVEQGPRRDTGFIVADVELDDRRSFFLEFGGWLEILYVAPCIALAVAGLAVRRKGSKLKPDVNR
jgi:apolipoprotein N-acyltransferase